MMGFNELPGEIRGHVDIVRPYGELFCYAAQSQEQITGTFSYNDQDVLGTDGGFNHMRSVGAVNNMYIMLCGQMTPHEQK